MTPLTARRPSRLLGFALAFAFVVAACGNRKADAEDAKKSETDIKAQLGVDSTIDVRSVSGPEGDKLMVTVQLKTPPPGDSIAFKAKVTDIVTKDFRAHVDSVALAF